MGGWFRREVAGAGDVKGLKIRSRHRPMTDAAQCASLEALRLQKCGHFATPAQETHAAQGERRLCI
jgi:hypothetical protein